VRTKLNSAVNTDEGLKNIFINESENKKEKRIMKHKLSTTLALVVLTIALGVSSVKAQTVANGPYYAPPSWDQTLPSSTRFIVLSNFASNAVLDRETGLVWQRSPNETPELRQAAFRRCWTLNIGGRQGWRIPTVAELMSLADPANTMPFQIRIPTGHPFLFTGPLAGGAYWAADQIEGLHYAVYFGSASDPNGNAGGALADDFNTINAQFPTWCVRSEQGSVSH
jgi:hypothetical protein